VSVGRNDRRELTWIHCPAPQSGSGATSTGHTCFVPAVLLSRTIDEIVKLHTRYIKTGPIVEDQLLIILILNALGGQHSMLQTSINDLLQNPSTTPCDVRSRLLREEQTISARKKQGTENSALAATSSKPTRPVCSNCKRLTHHTEYCISPGG
jgi:hypothetical protein